MPAWPTNKQGHNVIIVSLWLM